MPDSTSFAILDVQKIFDEVIKRTQLRTRSMPDGAADLIAMTEDDIDSVHLFLSNAQTKLGQRLGSLGDLTITEDEVVHKLDDKQTEVEFKKAAGLLKQAIVSYVLYEWYKSVGQPELAAESYQEYDKTARDYKFNSRQQTFVTPKYRPYF